MPSLLALAYLIGPGSLLALTCYVIALRRLPASAVSTYAYVNPVVAALLGTLILGEWPTLTTLFGGAFVVTSVALLLIHQRPTTSSRRPRVGRAVLGHSFSGQLALEYALRYPARLSHLVLLDTGGDSRCPQQNAADQRRQVSPAGRS